LRIGVIGVPVAVKAVVSLLLLFDLRWFFHISLATSISIALFRVLVAINCPKTMPNHPRNQVPFILRRIR
jgi:uncharacterized SAM-binding protein YcdF (DUF218 family)